MDVVPAATGIVAADPPVDGPDTPGPVTRGATITSLVVAPVHPGPQRAAAVARVTTRTAS